MDRADDGSTGKTKQKSMKAVRFQRETKNVDSERRVLTRLIDWCGEEEEEGISFSCLPGIVYATYSVLPGFIF